MTSYSDTTRLTRNWAVRSAKVQIQEGPDTNLECGFGRLLAEYVSVFGLRMYVLRIGL
jgi:hypothetical protein